MKADVGGYRVKDVEISAAFDVNATKVGLDVAEAIFTEPNNTARFCDVARCGVTVQRGPTFDGLGRYLKEEIEESEAAPVDVAAVLDASHTDVLVSYLPVGSQKATEYYAEQALEAGCAFVNCIPVFIASDPEWQRRFERRNLPIIGDEHPAFFASSRATLNITRADMARMGGVRRGASSKPPRVKRRFSPMRGKA